MMKWFKKKDEQSPSGPSGNKRLTEEQKAAREEAKKLALEAAEEAGLRKGPSLTPFARRSEKSAHAGAKKVHTPERRSAECRRV